jgi:hypothetical protein
MRMKRVMREWASCVIDINMLEAQRKSHYSSCARPGLQMIRLKAACASGVTVSASSRIIILKGGLGILVIVVVIIFPSVVVFITEK